MSFEEKHKKQRKRLIFIFSGVILVILMSGGFAGNHYRKAFKKQINKEISQKDSIISASKIKEDSLIQLSTIQIDYADQIREQNDQLQLRNNNLYYELKKRNKQVFIIDTSFVVNANRISNRVNRFQERKDTLR